MQRHFQPISVAEHATHLLNIKDPIFMTNYIVIMSSVIRGSRDLNTISLTLDFFANIVEWSIDLDDCDNILRICCSEDVSISLKVYLEMSRIECSILAVFKSPEAF